MVVDEEVSRSTSAKPGINYRPIWTLRQQRENKLPVAGVARLRASHFKTEFWRIRLRPQVRYYPANA